MKLRALELDQFRKFDRPVRLEGLGDGINVLCGPNEFGKSTLLAALRAALFDRYKAKSELITSYRPHRNATAPFVAAEFEWDGETHRIEKRFLSRPSVRLRSGGALLEGDAAEERLGGILGVEAAGGRGRAEAASIWNALLVSQGESFAQADLGEGARASLSACLEAEIGTLSGGAAAAGLLKRVGADLALLLDGHGKPKNRYREALAAQDEAAERLRALEAQRAALEQDLADLLEARHALRREEDAERAGRLGAELDEARRDREARRNYTLRRDEAVAALRLAEADEAAVAREVSRRRDRAAALSRAQAALAPLRAAEAEAEARRARSEAAQAERQAAHRACAESLERHAQAQARAAAVLALVERGAARVLLAARCARADAAAQALAEADAALASLRIDGAGLRRIEDATLALDRAAAAAEAQAAALELELAPEAAERVRIDGMPVQPGPSGRRLLLHPTEIEIAGIGRLRIVPAAGQAAVLEAKRRQAELELRRLLEEAGCADRESAVRALERRRALEADRDAARRVLAEAAPGEASAGDAKLGLAPGPDALRHRLRALEDAAEAERIRLDLPSLPSAGEAERARDAALSAWEAARDAEARARDALLAPDADRGIADAALAQARAERLAGEREIARLGAEDAEAQVAEGDAALAARLAARSAALHARRDALALLEAAEPEGTLAMAEARIARLQAAEENRRATLSDLRERVARLDARVRHEEGIGLDERMEAARRDGETAAALAAGHKREADILLLLRDTLAEAERAARERTLRPLTGRLLPALGALFPRARLSLDDAFRIAALGRGDADEPLDSLSAGTREQVAILSRLAFADMLLASGKPALLVLDDALAFADARRAERVFDILSEAASRLQILVLTCRDELFAGLGGRRVTLSG